MFRAAKNILFIIVTVIGLLLLSIIVKDYDENSLPASPTTITVNSWDHHHKKAAIFNELAKTASKDNYQLALVRTSNLNGRISKEVYRFNPKQAQPLSFYRNSSVRHITKQQLNLQEVKGSYYTNATGASLTRLQAKLTELGLSSSTSTLSLPKILLSIDALTSYLTIILSILSILLVIMFMEKIANSKRYAILQLNGWSIEQILAKDIKAGLPAFSISLLALLAVYLGSELFTMTLAGIWFSLKYALVLLAIIILIFISFDLFSYLTLPLINIYRAVQGQTYTKPFIAIGYLLKLVLILIVLTNVFLFKADFNHYQTDRGIMQMWINRRSGYVLQFTNVDDSDEREVNRLAKATRRLIARSPQAIISKNNQTYQPNRRSLEPSNGNVLIVNKNYLKYNKIRRKDNTSVDPQKLPNDKVTVLIPSTRTDQTTKFLHALRSFIKFQNTLPSLYHQQGAPPIKVLNYQGQQDVFNYTIGNEIGNSISRDPMIILINPKMLADDFYWALTTQGLVQFQNLHQLQHNIAKVGLSSNIAGITDAKTRLSDFNLKQVRRLLLMCLTVILSFAQLLIVIAFISLAFLQKQRPKLAILKIFGQSHLRVLSSFLTINVLGDFVLLICFMLVNHLQIESIVYMLPYLISEIAVILLLTKHAEKDLLTTLNRGN